MGALKLGDYLDSHYAGTNARAATLVMTSGSLTSVVALRIPFFDSTTDNGLQKIVGIHELLHVLTGMGDHIDLAKYLGISLQKDADGQTASKSINDWIRAKCML